MIWHRRAINRRLAGVCTDSTFSATPSTCAVGTTVTCAASVAYTGNVAPVHSLWKKTPGGVWTSIGPQPSPSFSFVVDAAGFWQLQIWSKMPDNPAAYEVISANNAYAVT